MTDTTADFLAQSDYEKHDPFVFGEVGATISGTICEPPRVVEVDSLNAPGEKVKKLVIAVDTGKGVFSVWINRGLMAGAVSKAVKAAGVTEIVEGGTLGIKHTGVAEPKQRGFNGAKEFQAKYTPPAAGANVDVFDEL